MVLHMGKTSMRRRIGDVKERDHRSVQRHLKTHTHTHPKPSGGIQWYPLTASPSPHDAPPPFFTLPPEGLLSLNGRSEHGSGEGR